MSMSAVKNGSSNDGAIARIRRIFGASPDHAHALHPSASFSATMRVCLENQPGVFAALAEAIGEAGGLLGAIDLVRVGENHKVRDVTFLAADAAHVRRGHRRVRRLGPRRPRPRRVGDGTAAP